MLNLSEMRHRFSVRRAGTAVLERQMKRSLARSWPIGAVLYAVSTWLSADGVLVLGTALAAEHGGQNDCGYGPGHVFLLYLGAGLSSGSR